MALGLMVLLFLISPANAKDPCQAYRNMAPLPPWYSKMCSGDGRSKGGIGGAYSTFGDAFNLNPAAIPTESIPLGVEYISSLQNRTFQNNFSFIKGFHGLGGALTTNSDDTFYGHSLFKNLNGVNTSNPAKGITSTTGLPTMNLGTALNLDSWIPSEHVSFTLGALVKYNKDASVLTPGYGFSIATNWIWGGFAVSKVFGLT